MNKQYNKTITACFVGYIVQAIINNFVPLLFLTFERTYQIPLSRITLLVTINFGVQLFVDLLSVKFVDKIGYRASMVIAHLCSAAGLVLLTILPEVMDPAFLGILTAVVVYAIGGGLLEVLVSPIVEACPTEKKEAAMSLLHSFYCWGHVAVIPLANALAFTKVPIAPLLPEGESGLRMKDLLGMKLFWILFIMMVCAGASEQAVSQWASTFAEQALGITKTLGDLAGPMAFAILMGASRFFYGKYGDRIDLDRFMIFSSLLCILSYLGISLIPVPLVSLAACAVCGLSVGIMWPGTFSKASQALRRGGTAMFALLALGGDVGCSGGPTLVGLISSSLNDNLKAGILAAIIFPVLLLTGILLCRRMKKQL